MRLNKALITIATIGGLALSGCSVSVGTNKSVDVDDLEQSLADRLRAEAGVAPKNVECPDDVVAETGDKFRCVITAPNEEEIGMTVTITGWAGDRVRWKYKVDETTQGAISSPSDN